MPQPRADAARDVERRVADQSHGQRDGHDGRALEEIFSQSVARQRDDRDERDGDGGGDRRDFADDRPHPVAEGPTVGDGAADFLFEGQEEPGYEREHHEPQRDDRLEAVLSEGLLAEAEKDVDRDAADEQPGADSEAARGQRVARTARFRLFVLRQACRGYLAA